MYLGIDGGGTKTAFALLHADGRLLARHDSGSAYYLEAGLEGVSATPCCSMAWPKRWRWPV